MLVPRLLPHTAQELLDAAAGRTRDQVAHLLAARFPKPDVPTVIEPLPVSGSAPSVTLPAQAQPASLELSAPGRISPIVCPPAALVAAPAEPRPRVAPLSPERYAVQVTVSKATHDKLRRAQELLSHALPSGDVAEIIDRALDALILQVERRKFAATDQPRRPTHRPAKDTRHIPAEVKRRVRERDGGRCTFVDDRGCRCAERKFLEYDHELPVARGGPSTVSNVRLRCRAHNQYAAECAFGAGFMQSKRNAARDVSTHRDRTR